MTPEQQRKKLLESIDEPRKGKRIMVYGADAIVQSLNKDGTRTTEVIKDELR